MGEEPDRKRAEGEISKAGVCRYMKLREAYESGLYEKKAVLGKIQNELACHPRRKRRSVILSLLQAETYLDAERPDQAALCLDDAWETVSALRDRIEHSIVITSTCSTVWNRTRRRRTLCPPVQEKAGGRQRPVLSAAFCS